MAPAFRITREPTPMIVDWITPALVVAVGLGLWRYFHTELRSLRQEIRTELRHLHDRLDRHLEGHP